MSCSGCAQSFGFLRRELGCPKCGFSYCKKCLRFKAKDPKTAKEILICQRCDGLSTSKIEPEEPLLITKALQRLESMENPSRPPITVYKQPAREARLAQLKKGLSIEDQQLADRLESLRKHDHGTSNVGHRRSSDQIEEEIQERLARLKDEDPSLKASNCSSMNNFKSKPETEQDLIAKFAAEVELDNQYHAGLSKAVGSIESRLSKLKGSSSAASASQGEGSSSINKQQSAEEPEELSEEEQIARIINRFKTEVELESNEKGTDNSDSNDPHVEDVSMDSAEYDSGDNDEDVDNLCRICDEKRAIWKCEECDGDIFCKKCFHELHKELGEMHKPTQLKR